MKQFAAILTAISLAVIAPLAGADTAQLELMPKVGGAESTQYVSDERASAPGTANVSDEFYFRHTGGISPQ